VRGKWILHRIGHILHVSSTKNIILKAEKLPHIGDRVADENLKPVGMVFDIFGPTHSPYVAVKPNIRNTAHLVNQVLYATPSRSRTRKRKKR
jgi:RNA-binding protein